MARAVGSSPLVSSVELKTRSTVIKVKLAEEYEGETYVKVNTLKKGGEDGKLKTSKG